MLDRLKMAGSVWLLDHVAPDWVNYVVSNTMTDLNRWFNDFIWSYDVKARVEAVVDEAPGVKTYVLRPNQHWKPCQSGQHVRLHLNVDGERVERCYSVSAVRKGQSAHAQRICITVKRQQGGKVSGWLHDHLRIGTVLTLEQAQGQFVRQSHEPSSPALFIAAGSGVTPIRAMVDAHMSQASGQRPDVQVLLQFRQAQDIIFRSDWAQWAQQGLPVTVNLSQLDAAAASVGLNTRHGRLDRQALQQVPDLTTRNIYLCGPDAFMRQMLTDLAALGVDPARIHTERFSFDTAGAGMAELAGGLEGAELVFAHVNACVSLTHADQGKTLLQLAHDHGIPLESGCTKGACGTCKLVLHEGEVSGNVLGRSVYLCTSFPASRRVVLGS